jgi:protein associated with RNAse G/E
VEEKRIKSAIFDLEKLFMETLKKFMDRKLFTKHCNKVKMRKSRISYMEKSVRKAR